MPSWTDIGWFLVTMGLMFWIVFFVVGLRMRRENPSIYDTHPALLFPSIIWYLVTLPFVSWRNRRKQTKARQFEQVFGFDPINNQGSYPVSQTLVLKTLLELGDKMVTKKEGKRQYREAESLARKFHFLTDTLASSLFTDPDTRADTLLLLDNFPPEVQKTIRELFGFDPETEVKD